MFSYRAGILQDEVGPAGFPLQHSALYEALPSGSLCSVYCQAWQLTCASRSLPPSQQHGKGSSPPPLPQPHSAFPNAGSHTPQFTWRAAPRGDSKSRQTLRQLPTACKPGVHFLNTHTTPHKSSLTPRCPSPQSARTRAESFLSSQLPALNATLFHVQRTDPTNVIQAVLLWNNRSGMKSPAIS